MVISRSLPQGSLGSQCLFSSPFPSLCAQLLEGTASPHTISSPGSALVSLHMVHGFVNGHFDGPVVSCQTPDSYRDGLWGPDSSGHLGPMPVVS